MAILNGKKHTAMWGGIDVKTRSALQDAVIRFDQVNTAPTTTSGHRYLYVNSSNELIFNNGSTVTTIGAAGSVASGTWDSIYAGDKTLNVSGTTFTIDKSAGNQDVLTITNSGAGTGACIQITNVGTGSDIDGTSDSWSVSKTGVAVFEEITVDGTEGSNVFTVTKGDTRFLDGAVAITDDDDAASFTLTNNTATTASVAVIAGSGAFTGSTTTSFMTITPSGLTTGTAVYLPVAALTTGKALHIVGNAVTDGMLLDITSSSAVQTATGRLLHIASTATTNTSAVLNEFATAATDETVLLRLTASDALALGTILHLSASSMTTGTAIDGGALDALTTGIGLSLASTSTTTTTGSLIRVSTGTTGAVATNGIVSITATGAYTSTSNCGLLQVVANSVTTGATVLNVSGTAATTSVVARFASTGTGLTSGSVILATTGTTGAIATNGAFSFTGTGDFTVGAVGLGLHHISGNSTTAGTVASVSGTALTTGVALHIASTGTGMTSGSLLRATTGTTGAVATNGVISIRSTGAYTSTSNAGLLDVQSSAATGTATIVNIKATAAAQTDTTLLNVEASGFTTGYTGSMVRITSPTTTGACKVVDLLADGITTDGTAMDISTDALTTGIALNIANSGGAMTTGSLLRVAAQGTGAIATNGIVSFTHTGDFTSTSAVNGGFVEVKANDTLAGTVFNLVADALTTGIGMQLSNGTSGMTSGSLLRVTTSGTGTVATNGIVSVTHAGVFTSTSNAGVLDVRLSAATGAATAANFMTTAAGQTATTVLNVENSGFTTGYTGEMLRIKTPSTTGACKVVSVIADGMTTAGVGINVSTAALDAGGIGIQADLTAATAGNALKLVTTGAYTGTGMGLITVGAMTTGIGLSVISTTGLTSGSLIRATTSTAGALQTNGAVSITGTGAFTSTNRVGLLEVQGNTSTAGTVAHFIGTSLTSGNVLSLEADALTSGFFLQCYDTSDGNAKFTVGLNGATVITGLASGTAALTITNGDLAVSGGTFSVSGASTFTGLATFTTGFQATPSAVTATVDGLGTGLINAGERYITVTAGADANSIITLPASTIGHVVTGYIGATGCEMRTPAGGGATINGVDSDGTNEAAIPATTMFEVTCVATDTWILRAWTELGAVITAIVPDAA